MPRPPVAGAPRHLEIAARYVGERETHGPNRSPNIDRWNRAVGAAVGSPYCASFVSWVLSESGAAQPTTRTAWARSFYGRRSRSAQETLRGEYRPQAGDIAVWTRPGGGHVGFVTEWRGAAGQTIEANTSAGDGGSQFNGDGVWRRRRRLEPFNKFRIIGFTPVTYQPVTYQDDAVPHRGH